MKNGFLKYFVITFFMSITFTKSSFADIADYIIENNVYNVEYDKNNNTAKFSSWLGKNVLNSNSTAYFWGDDFNNDISNGYCWLGTHTNSGGHWWWKQTLERARNLYYDGQKGEHILTICGSDWLTWGNKSVVTEIENNGGCGEDDNCVKYKNIKEYYPELGAFNGSYKYDVEKCLNNRNNCENIIKRGSCTPEKKGNSTTCVPFDGTKKFTIRDKIYRERLYDGEEINFGNCKDPRPGAKLYDINTGKSVITQSYYFKGLNSANYACERFLQGKKADGDEFDEAYKCCKKMSKNICVKNRQSGISALCSPEKTGKCWLGTLNKGEAVELKITESTYNGKTIYCASTYSLCPYNFNIESGTEQAYIFKRQITQESYERCQEAKSEKDCEIEFVDECIKNSETGEIYGTCNGRIKNFYQYLRHCTIIETSRETKLSLPDSYFLDKSCINLIGSSHNTYGYESYNGYGLAPRGLYRFSLSAPAAECFIETAKNFLFNRAGYTKCENSKLVPNENDECLDGKYRFKFGQTLAENEKGDFQRPLNKLLKFIRNIVMIATSLMITLYGYKVLFKGGKLGSSGEFIMTIIKISIVVTLVNTTFWYDFLFNFTYNLSETFVNVVSKIGFETTIDENGNFVKDDGCFFGDINSIIPSSASIDIKEAAQKYNDNRYNEYPAGRKYVAFFDTLDCKMAKYFGYKHNYSLIGLIGTSLLWPFNIMIYIAISSILVALLLFNFIVKTVYFFAGATIAMTLLLFLSPIIIPTILFEKTKKIFDKWLKNLLGFALQPMILVAYVSISIMIIDKVTLGEGIFSGQAPYKDLICGTSCKDKNTQNIKAYTDVRFGLLISEEKMNLINNILTTFVKINNVGKIPSEDCEFVDIQKHSVLCFINNIMTKKLWFGIPVAVNIVTSDIIMFVRLTFLLFILNKLLSTIPGIASILTGGSGIPGSSISADPFTIAGKIGGALRGIKRTAVKLIFGLGNSTKNKYKEYKAKKAQQSKEK